MDPLAIIVEDHPLYLEALVELLRPILGDSNVIAARSAEEGLCMVAAFPQLRIAIIDLDLPGMSGAEAIAAFRNVCPAAAIVVVSATDDRRDINAAFRAGAHMAISKATPKERLVEAVECLLSGPPLTQEWITPLSTLGALAKTEDITLTPRQRQVLFCLCNGYSNKEIGLRLAIEEPTVKVHVSSVLRVLGVVNRQEAILKAQRLGLHLQHRDSPKSDDKC